MLLYFCNGISNHYSQWLSVSRAFCDSTVDGIETLYMRMLKIFDIFEIIYLDTMCKLWMDELWNVAMNTHLKIDWFI